MTSISDLISPFKICESLLGLDIIRGLINSLQIFGDGLAVLSAAESQGLAHQMHDAGLSSETHHREPKHGPLIARDPQAQNLRFTLVIDAQDHVNGPIFNLTAFRITDFDPKRVKENNGVHRLQRAVLPTRDVLQDSVVDAVDKIG